MNYFDILFYAFAALALLSALVVVFSNNIIHSAFALMFTFLGVAGLYVLLMADFIAVAQIMVYVGGILVLMIFGVMLTHRATNVDIRTGTFQTLPAIAVVGVFLGTLIVLMTRAQWSTSDAAPTMAGTTTEIGELLLTTFVMPFEVSGLLLLVAIMGAAMIARRGEGETEEA